MKFGEIKTKLVESKRKLALALVPVGSIVALAVPAFAADASTFDLTALMTTAMTKIVSDLFAMITGVLPVGITVIGASVGIAYSIKFIRKITHA